MPTALVETKFFVPHARTGLVARPRLDRGTGIGGTRLTLLSAPAGFGKTTLLSRWLTGAGEASGKLDRIAWVSLDSGDREAKVFWTYLLTALERAAPGSGGAGLGLLDSGQPIEVVLAAALNELSVLPDDVAIVLDDYHLAESPEVQSGMAFLLERLPPQVTLVISTRVDPALPLARLRARGELTELRAGDLRFTDEETTAFLADATGLNLHGADVAALAARTEGWIASLQLAALSLRGREDPSAFIEGFAGDDRYVVDYLVEEVLDREPADIRDFLLATAILGRMSGPLCDAVTGSSGGAQMLDSLERRNLFVVPLDDQRRWYRYHHLFADVLHAHLLIERPGDAAMLHRRASDWWAGADEPEEAVRHALAAGDVVAAADLVEGALPELRRQRRESVIRRWVDELPDDVVRDRPVLASGLIGGLMASNDFDRVEERLRDLERTLARPADEVAALDPSELSRVPATIPIYRAGLALIGGDLPGAIAHAERAMAVSVENDDLANAAAASLAGLAFWGSGDILEAHGAYSTAVEGLTRIGHMADVMGCSLAMADMELALGRLGDAERTLQGALDLADRGRSDDSPALRGSADMVVGLSRAAWHRNDLAAADELLRRADALGEAAGLPQHPYRWRVALARLRAAESDFAAALELLDEAERVYVSDFSPPVHPIHATRARVLVASGDVDAASSWAHRHDVEAADLSYLTEYQHVTLARVLLAEHEVGRPGEPLQAAITLLGRLATAAESGRRHGSLIEIEILRSVALQASGDVAAARSAFGRAVDLAEPDGWVRFFVDAGPRIAELLRAVAAERPLSVPLRDLLDATAATEGAAAGRSGAAGGPAEPRRSVLVDPLSDRELDVLRLLASDLDGPAIARELVVSLNTVRTHTKHIYTKLDVNNRRSAVTKAHQLGLLARSAPADEANRTPRITR